jgi:threonine synthase
VVLPTGYGELLFGVAKGFRELKDFGVADKMPCILSSEPAVRAPLAYAMAHNQAAAEVSGPRSLAAGIATTVSSYRGAVALRSGRGHALTFHESTIGEAARELARDGLWQEYSGAAGLAALREAKRRGETIEEPVVAVLTSTGLKEMPAPRAASADARQEPLDAIIASLKKQ